jgi:DNA transformation protein and related proteins
VSEFTDHVTELMRPWARVTVRRMFGGHGLFRDGLMFALTSDDALYLKADAETAPQFAAQGCQPFVYAGKARTVQLGYWSVPPECIESAAEMVRWCALAWQAALNAQRAKRAGAPKAARIKAAPKNASMKRTAPKR